MKQREISLRASESYGQRGGQLGELDDALESFMRELSYPALEDEDSSNPTYRAVLSTREIMSNWLKHYYEQDIHVRFEGDDMEVRIYLRTRPADFFNPESSDQIRAAREAKESGRVVEFTQEKAKEPGRDGTHIGQGYLIAENLSDEIKTNRWPEDEKDGVETHITIRRERDQVA